MKKVITKKLCMVILTTMLVTLVLNYYLQINSAQKNVIRSSQIKINQIEQILEQNFEDVEKLQASLKEDYIIRAKAAAYIVQNKPEIIGNQEEMDKIAELLQVDEFHLFNREGSIYAGSEPKYFGYSFHSGEQMMFFLPMLEDESLIMSQDMTYNTAEHKLMQYTAVWREDKEGIVQIGMEPKRLLEAMERNELPHIFSMVTPEEGTIIYVIDKNDGAILGSTDRGLIGQNMAEAGLAIGEGASQEEGFYAAVRNIPSYCVFKDTGSLYIGMSQSKAVLYGSIMQSMLMVLAYLGVTSLIMILAIIRHVDRYIISGIDVITDGLTKITSGNLDTTVEVDTTPEFAKLSGHINKMVVSLLGVTAKLSRIFDMVNVLVGVYEYSSVMKRVLATRKVTDILMLTEEESKSLLEDKKLFEEKLDEIYSHPVAPYQNVYKLQTEQEYFVRIQSFTSENSTLGIVTDVTEEVQEKQRLKYEAEYDHLTELYTRRAFYSRMDVLFSRPELLKQAVLIMLDIDNLKYINDTFGHAEGDKAIRAAAGMMRQCAAPNKVLVRLSGDEFAIFIYGSDSKEELQEYVNQIGNVMRQAGAEFLGTKNFSVRLSAGYVFYPEFNMGYDKLLKLADTALYQSKRERKGVFRLYRAEAEAE